MNLAGQVDHLINMGPYDQPSTPDTKYETPPPPAEEDEEEEYVGENEIMDRKDELGEEPIDEGNPREEPLDRETSHAGGRPRRRSCGRTLRRGRSRGGSYGGGRPPRRSLRNNP